jgi:hypothetical protein
LAKQLTGAPMNSAPALNTSGYTASMCWVITPPEELPVAYTRLGSPPYCLSVYVTIETMDTGSLPPPRRLDASDQLSKQLPKPTRWVAVG